MEEGILAGEAQNVKKKPAKIPSPIIYTMIKGIGIPSHLNPILVPC